MFPNPEDGGDLEWFLGLCLSSEGGVWDGPRVSDGIEYLRVVEHEPERMRVCGRVWEIHDQSLHSFWLEVARTSDDGFSWTVHYDPVASSLRRAHNAVHVLEEADGIEWRLTLEGRAELRDGALCPI